jgi:hypothetical protein
LRERFVAEAGRRSSRPVSGPGLPSKRAVDGLRARRPTDRPPRTRRASGRTAPRKKLGVVRPPRGFAAVSNGATVGATRWRRSGTPTRAIRASVAIGSGGGGLLERVTADVTPAANREHGRATVPGAGRAPRARAAGGGEVDAGPARGELRPAPHVRRLGRAERSAPEPAEDRDRVAGHARRLPTESGTTAG